MAMHFITLLPASICLIFFFAFLARKGKTASDKVMMLVCLSMAALLYTGAINMTKTSTLTGYINMAWSNIFTQYLMSTMPLLTIIYLQIMRGHKYNVLALGFCISIPIFLGGVGTTASAILGIDNIAKLLCYQDGDPIGICSGTDFTDIRFRFYTGVFDKATPWILLTEAILLMLYIIHSMANDKYSFKGLYRYTFRKGTITPLNIQYVHIILFVAVFTAQSLIGRQYFINHPGVVAIISLFSTFLSFMLCYSAYLEKFGRYTMAFMASPLTYLNLSEDVEITEEPHKGGRHSITETVEEVTSLKEGLEGRGAQPADEQEEAMDPKMAEHVEEFETYIREKRPFLSPGVTATDVAEDLGYDLNLVIQIVSARYKMSFNAYMNWQRIEDAKRIILAEPDTKLDEIAARCGFTNTPLFNMTFKRITGFTPRVWQATRRY